MTDPNYTALLLVIDRSGSMATIREDMIGGLQTLIDSQAADEGRLTVDVVDFDDEIVLRHTMADPRALKIELDPRGSTALYDAIGISMQGFGDRLSALPEDARPETVQVIVVTDGQENASREYNAAAVRALITTQKNQYSWDFVFLGANQDAVLTGSALGFDAESSLTFAAAGDEVHSMSESLNRYVKDVRGKTKEGFSTQERQQAARADTRN
jgi:hypothetical protein